MRKFPIALGALSIFTLTFASMPGDELDKTGNALPKITVSPFNAFTGKVSKSKVRLRTGSSLDSAIVRELSKGELLIVIGEADDFYAVQPPPDIKGYVFRTFVLDNKIEGNRVNIRLNPNTEAPVIAQMNSGEPVEGMISSLNSKWLEIAPPPATRMYVAKEFVQKVGDQHFMAKIAKRRDEVNDLLQSNYSISQQEMQKPFDQIHLDGIIANYQKIIQEYSDFSDQATRAKELLEELNDNYLHKKVAYLESKAENPGVKSIAAENPQIVVLPPTDAQARLIYWEPYEQSIYAEWSKEHPGTVEDYYAEQKKNSLSLHGIVEPYSRKIKNKPGDYVLTDPQSQLPIAFLYSTKINLNDKVGQFVTVDVSERPNYHFAYPAYFVLSLE